MKQIKTILEGTIGEFDEAVNSAIAEGWQLTKRDLRLVESKDQGLLYAELEREIITDAERCCENCKHYHLEPEQEPCFNCSETASNWEAAE